MSWTNNTGTDLDVVLEVQAWDDSGNGDCANYDLIIAGSGNCNGNIGTEYCTAAPNSTVELTREIPSQDNQRHARPSAR